MVPGCIGYVYLGAAAGNAASGGDGGGLVKMILTIVGALAAVFAVGLAAKEAKKELDAAIAQSEEATAGGGPEGGMVAVDGQAPAL